MNVLVFVQECIDLPGLMSREVIGDHVNVFAARLIGNDVAEKGDEFS